MSVKKLAPMATLDAMAPERALLRPVGRPRAVSDADVFASIGSLVTAGGPNAVTFAAVGAAVGVTASALAQRFGSKRGLLVAFASRATTTVDDVFAAARSTHPDPVDALLDALGRSASAITTREELANNLAFLQLDLADPELRALAVAHRRRMRRHIVGLLREAHERGVVVDVRPADIADLVESVYSGALLTWAVDGSGSLQRHIQRRLRRLLEPYVVRPPA